MKFKSIVWIDHQHVFPCLFFTIFFKFKESHNFPIFYLKNDELMSHDLVSHDLVSHDLVSDDLVSDDLVTGPPLFHKLLVFTSQLAVGAGK